MNVALDMSDGGEPILQHMDRACLALNRLDTDRNVVNLVEFQQSVHSALMAVWERHEYAEEGFVTAGSAVLERLCRQGVRAARYVRPTSLEDMTTLTDATRKLTAYWHGVRMLLSGTREAIGAVIDHIKALPHD